MSSLSHSKFIELIKGQTAVAQRVYECVPLASTATTQQINKIAHEKGAVRNFQVLEGCLNNLTRYGLLYEPEPGHFARVRVRPKQKREIKVLKPAANPALLHAFQELGFEPPPAGAVLLDVEPAAAAESQPAAPQLSAPAATEESPLPNPNLAVVPATPTKSALDKLADLSKESVDIASEIERLTQRQLEIAKEVEGVALEVQEEIDAQAAKYEKVKQFVGLLKGMDV